MNWKKLSINNSRETAAGKYLDVGWPLQRSVLQERAPLWSQEYVSTATEHPLSSLMWIGFIIDFKSGSSPCIPILEYWNKNARKGNKVSSLQLQIAAKSNWAPSANRNPNLGTLRARHSKILIGDFGNPAVEGGKPAIGGKMLNPINRGRDDGWLSYFSGGEFGNFNKNGLSMGLL